MFEWHGNISVLKFKANHFVSKKGSQINIIIGNASGVKVELKRKIVKCISKRVNTTWKMNILVKIDLKIIYFETFCCTLSNGLSITPNVAMYIDGVQKRSSFWQKRFILFSLKNTIAL